MVSIQRRSSALLAVVLLALVMAVPQLAFAAEGNSEDAAALQGGQFQAAPAVTVRYAVDAGGAWSWGADGATSSVAKGKQFTALRLQASGQVSGAIQYQAYVRGYGWQAVKANGKVAGTTGKKAKRVEAVRIALTGELASWYDVQYQVMGSNGKWQGWKANGKTAGKTGSKLRGLQVKLVPKARQSAAGKGLVNVRYRTKLKGSSKWLTYTQNNGKAGRTGKAKRISNFAIALDRGAYSGNIMYRVRLSSGKWKAWKKNGTDQFEQNITDTAGFYTSVTVSFTKFYLTSDTGKNAITGNALGAYAGTYNFKVAVDTSVAKCTAVLPGTEPTTVELLNAMVNNTEVSFTLTIDASGNVSNDASTKAWVALRGSEGIKDGSEIGALKVVNG